MELKRHQQELIEDWGQNMRPLLLAGCVGSGKTASAIMLDVARRQANPRLNPTLIIVPASVKFNWGKEIEMWSGAPYRIIDGPPKQRRMQMREIEDLGNANSYDNINLQYVVTNYDTVRIEWEWFQTHGWYQVIVDEAHNIKNPSALRTYAVKAPNALSRMALTGTPIRNKPNDLWSILHFLEPGDSYKHKKRNYKKKEDRIPDGLRMRRQSTEWGNYKVFKDRYTQQDWYGNVKGGRRLDELNRRLEPIMVRWRKEDVLADLPDLRPPNIVSIQLTSQQTKLYQDMRDGYFAWLEQTDMARYVAGQPAKNKENRRAVYKEIKAILAQLTYFRRITSMSPRTFARRMMSNAAREAKKQGRETQDCFPAFTAGISMGDSQTSAKAAWIQEFLEYSLDEGEKLVILCIWKDTVDELAVFLQDYKPVTLTGNLSAKKRQEVIEGFDKVFIGSSAAFEGINLQAAHTVVWVDLPWNSTAVTQGNGRIHRIGQHEACDVFMLLAEETIDQRVFEMNRAKAQDIALAIDGGFSKELLQFGLRSLL